MTDLSRQTPEITDDESSDHSFIVDDELEDQTSNQSTIPDSFEASNLDNSGNCMGKSREYSSNSMRSKSNINRLSDNNMSVIRPQRKTKKNVIKSDSESDSEQHYNKSRKQNLSDERSNVSDSDHSRHNSEEDIMTNKNKSADDSQKNSLCIKGRNSKTANRQSKMFDQNFKEKRYKNGGSVVGSDFETESEGENIHDSESEEPSLHSIIYSSEEDNVIEITSKMNSSKISEHSFGKEGIILNSTTLDSGNTNTPLGKLSLKRYLNKSMETPRIIKQMKELKTPCFTPRIPNQISESRAIINTPREVPPIIPSRSPSPELRSLIIASYDDEDVIDISSEDEIQIKNLKTPVKRIVQPTLDAIFRKKEPALVKNEFPEVNQTHLSEISLDEYEIQRDKVRKIEADMQKANNLLRTINLKHLPDEGKSIKDKRESLEKILIEEVKKLSKMQPKNGYISIENSIQSYSGASTSQNQSSRSITSQGQTSHSMTLQGHTSHSITSESHTSENQLKVLTWEQLESNTGMVQPKTFGKQAMSTYNAQKAVTLDRLQQLHGSLETCPKESDYSEDPKGLRVELMPHQKRALAWLIWREKQKPSGGILADDMGLGKTLTMIALLIKIKESEQSDNEDSDIENNEERLSTKFNGGTLIVCPASLINQWSGELEKRTKRGLISYEMYHGPKRETKPKNLARHDMVITTYSIINNECDRNGRSGAVFRVKWRRIVLDEAHQIRNYKSQTSIAVCQLSAKSRWALTGTPVHNKELDMYALLKYMRCTPFDDLQVWKRWVSDKSAGGQERLHTVISSLMLRRTKAELMQKGILNSLPERKWELIPVQLSKSELDIYNRILIFSRTLFAQFLHQRAEKNQDNIDMRFDVMNQPNGPNQEYFKMRQKLLRLNKVKDIKQHEILVLLLRLRQICCHPSLITGMLHEDIEQLDEEDDGNSEELDLLDQLTKLALDENSLEDPAEGIASDQEPLGLKDATKGFLNPSNPIFSKTRISSKIQTMLDVLKDKVTQSEDKAIIVSQWSSFLHLIAHHLKAERINYDQLDGTVPVHKRMVLVDNFNNPTHKVKVLLLSLTAGGVGLNLVGANHLFLLDLHWNPQLENQAQDRIYRVGQQKPVYVYKFMATDTIEKRILDLQEKKLGIANSMLTGTKQVIGSKLTLQDLRMLFEM